MRQRFTPNLTPRGRQRSNSTTTTDSTTTSNETHHSLPFIPPNSSKTTGDTTCEEIQTVEESSSVVIVKSTSKHDATEARQTNPINSKSSKESLKATRPASTRRSRIKPSATPVPRKRNIAKTRNEDNTQETCDSSTSEVVVEKDNESTPSKETQSKDKGASPESTENSTSKDADDTPITPVSQSQTPTEVPVRIGHSEEGKTPASNLLLSRRKRATPKICIPPRKQRSASVADKESDSQIDSQQDNVDIAHKEITESNEAIAKTAKRPRSQVDVVVVQEDIEVMEITVQAEQCQDVPDDEEQAEVEEEQTQTNKKIKGRKRKAPIRKPKEMLDPSKMTLQDLIYFNPKGNYMKSSVDAKRKKLDQQKRKSTQSTGNENSDSTVDVDGRNTENQSNNQQTTDNTSKTDKGGDSTLCAPQVKIGADGCIILDEESLVIRSATNSTLEEKDIIYEDASVLNFEFYGKVGRRARWSMPETLKFYKTLSQVGTDFQLMAPLFPMRNRKELKAKFKREEKMHYHLIDKALVHRTPISLEMFLQAEKDEGKNSKRNGIKQASNAADNEVTVIDS